MVQAAEAVAAGHAGDTKQDANTLASSVSGSAKVPTTPSPAEGGPVGSAPREISSSITAQADCDDCAADDKYVSNEGARIYLARNKSAINN